MNMLEAMLHEGVPKSVAHSVMQLLGNPRDHNIVLIEKWRAAAERMSYRPGDTGSLRMMQCASELETALAAHSTAVNDVSVSETEEQSSHCVEVLSNSSHLSTNNQSRFSDGSEDLI